METTELIQVETDSNTEALALYAAVFAAGMAFTVGCYYGGRFVAGKVLDWKDSREAKKAAKSSAKEGS